MAWIAPAVLGIVGMINQNDQTAKANAQNTAQQQAELQNAKNAATNAQELMAPWVTPAAAPLAKTTVANPTAPLSLGPVPGQQPPAAAAMQPPAQPRPQPPRMPQAAPMGAPPPGQPPPAPRPQLNPMQMAQIQQIMRQPQTVNTAPVRL